MNKSSALILAILASFLFLSCATTGDTSGSGELAYDLGMPEPDGVVNTGTAWGVPRVADMETVTYQEVPDALKVEQPYGATMWVYNFDGLTPNAPVEVRLDANIDTIENSAWVELFFRPGVYEISQEVWDARGDDHKWEQFGLNNWDVKWESGGFDPELGVVGMATEGWETILNRSYAADDQGRFYVAIQTGHWFQMPTEVTHYFSNLTVRSLE